MHGDQPARGDWTWPDKLPFGPIGLFALTALSYGAGSRLALLLIERSELWSVFFVPAGVMAAFLLRVRTRLWWVVVLAAGATEALMDLDFGYSTAATAGFVGGNVVGPVLGAWIVRSRCGTVDLSRLKDVGWFLAGSVVIGPLVAATIGSAVADASGEGEFLTQFWQWWLGDALGVVLVGSFILVWGSSPDRRSLRSVAGTVLLVGTLVLTVWVVALTHLPLVFLVLVGVIVAGVVFGPRGVAASAIVIALTKALDLAFGDGLQVPGLSQDEALMVVQLRLGIFTVAGLVLAAGVNEREAATVAALEARARALEAETAHRVEHEIAVYLQEGLLPDETTHHPNLTVAGRYVAGSEEVMVGGDWYDVTTLPDGRVVIVLGDVGGHGLEATTQMGRLRTATAAFSLLCAGPADLLSNLNRFAQGRQAVDYATVSCSILDPASGVLTYASAGHPPILVVTPSGDATWLDQATSRPLYGGSESERTEASLRIEPGSLLIGYTDGLVENMYRDIGVGLSRLEKTVTQVVDRSVTEICDLLLGTMGVAHSRRDDVVALVMRYEPPPAHPADREIVIGIERKPEDAATAD
ncbi:MAG TPA: SpoIIE family protein phosphatase [Acidimicrobiia bacterium]|nr:SpoIIE family protein phosphatase [Acidimicrobiia bacterium]